MMKIPKHDKVTGDESTYIAVDFKTKEIIAQNKDPMKTKEEAEKTGKRFIMGFSADPRYHWIFTP